jgi:hypothetical protein
MSSKKQKKIIKNVSLILHNRSGVNVTKLFALVLAKRQMKHHLSFSFRKKALFLNFLKNIFDIHVVWLTV